MPTPSLLIVPARFKTGKLYSQIPTSEAGDFTVTRNTEARRFDSAGLVASVASGIPRLDYYTSGGVTGCPALLVEPAGTNLAFHSETWANGNNWQLTNITRTTGSTDAFKAPDGTFTANAISPTSGNVAHYFLGNILTQIAYTSGTIYTQSAFFKQGTGVAGRYVQLVPAGSRFTQLSYANFDLQLGTVTVVSGSSADANRTARIENYGNGWYRCSITATCNASGSSFGVTPALITTSGDTRFQSFSGTVTDVLYGWGAQLETGSVATSYIPTTAGTGSRSADVVSVSGAVSGSIGQQSGTIYCEFQFNTPTIATAGVFSIESTNNANRVILWHNSSTNSLAVALRANNSIIFNGSIGTLVNGGYYKIAIGYSSGNSKVYLNGNSTAVVTDTSAYTMAAALNRVALGNYENSASNLTISRIRSFALYAERLTDSEMIALTT